MQASNRHASDRRAAPRFRISIPLHFQLTKSHEPECSAETLDISSRGMCMETDAPPGVGAILMVRLRMPEMIMGWRAPEWRITGHVVHVESGSEPGEFEVGVQFHYYEAAAPRRGRLLPELDATACA
jgi:c-di-GMP-binding flagellar brake protein YcgR